MDEPHPVLSKRWMVTTKPGRSQKGPKTSCMIHGAQWQTLQKRLLPALPEVCGGGRDQIRSRRGTRRSLQRPHRGKIPRLKDHKGMIFLAYYATRRSEFREKMWQLSKVWKCPTTPRGKNDDHLLTLAIRTVGDRHNRPPTSGKETDEVSTRRD